MQHRVQHPLAGQAQCLSHQLVGVGTVGTVSGKLGHVIAHVVVGDVIAGQHFVHLHHVGIVIHVGNGETAHACFTTEPVSQQLAVSTCPLSTQTVEGGHDALCIGLHNGQLEGTEVDFTQCLFVDPGADAGTVVFLIVQHKVLVVHIHALALDADGFSSVHQTGQDAVLRIVLEYTASIGRTVNVQTRAVQSGIACPHSVFTDELAHFTDQVIVEGCGDDAVAGVAGALGILHGIVGLGSIAVFAHRVLLGHAGRTVVVGGQGLADGVKVDGHAQTVGAQLGHFFIGQLIHEGIPHGIVIVVLQHVDQLQAGIHTHGRPFGSGIVRQVAVIQDGIGSHLSGHGQLYVAGGHGAFPVAAGVIHNGVVATAFIAVDVRVGEEAGHGVARAVRGGIGGAVEGKIHGVGQGSIALGGHAVFGGLALGSQNVVGGSVAVVSNGQVVAAFVQNVHTGAGGIIAGQVILGHVNGEHFAGTGLKDLCLVVAHQFHSGLFNAVCLVILGIGLLSIDLHGLLAGYAAGVGDLHGYGVVDARALAGLHDLHVTHGEVGVAQAVAEGISHVIRVGEVACLGSTQHHVFITGFGVLIANVDAFLVHNVLIVLVGVGAQVIAGGISIGVRTEVVHHRVQLIIRPPGIGQGAGGVHLAGEHIAYGVQTGLTHRANPQGSVHTIGRIIQEAYGHGVSTVDDHGNGTNLAILLQLVQAFQHGQLVFVQLQVVVIQGVVDGNGYVVAFAAYTADHINDVFTVADGIVIVLLNLAPLDLADLVAVPLGFLIHVVVKQSLVHHIEACVLHHIIVVGCTVGIHCAGTGTAVHRIQNGNTHQGYITAGLQGQHVALVLQQYNTFAFYLPNLGLTGSLQVCQGSILALVVAGVTFFFTLCQGADNLGGCSAQHGIDLTGALAGNYVAREDHSKKRCRNIQENLLECSFLGCLH